MQRVNGYQFYQLATAVHPISDLRTDQTIQNAAPVLHYARAWLEWLLRDRIVPMRISRPAAQQLLSTIALVLPQNYPTTLPANPEGQIGHHSGTLRLHAREFETVLAAELQDVDTYFIDKKGIYVTSDLIDRADLALDISARTAIPERAIKDFKESGKCLAFDLATAAGFHAMRATEAVLREYYALVVKPAAGTKQPEMAQCINELKAAGGDATTLAVLDQIRDLHRNPLMHPEIFLKNDEALRLFDIAKSAISAMADQIILVKSKALPVTTPTVP